MSNGDVILTILIPGSLPRSRSHAAVRLLHRRLDPHRRRHVVGQRLPPFSDCSLNAASCAGVRPLRLPLLVSVALHDGQPRWHRHPVGRLRLLVW